MVCGYCGKTVKWPTAALGTTRLTGFHLLGIHTPTGRLDVLAEATLPDGQITYLPHECTEISAEDRARYAPQTIPADQQRTAS